MGRVWYLNKNIYRWFWFWTVKSNSYNKSIITIYNYLSFIIHKTSSHQLKNQLSLSSMMKLFLLTLQYVDLKIICCNRQNYNRLLAFNLRLNSPLLKIKLKKKKIWSLIRSKLRDWSEHLMIIDYIIKNSMIMTIKWNYKMQLRLSIMNAINWENELRNLMMKLINCNLIFIIWMSLNYDFFLC